MIDVILMVGIFAGLALFVVLLIVEDFTDIRSIRLISLCISVICFIWLWFGIRTEIKYETEYYDVTTTKENVQLIITNDNIIINVNKKLGKIIKDNQMIERKNIKNHFRGGVYFSSDAPEYKIVDKKEKK